MTYHKCIMMKGKGKENEGEEEEEEEEEEGGKRNGKKKVGEK